MKLKSLSLILLIIFSALSFKTNSKCCCWCKKSSTYFVFGTGGGVAGNYTTYKLTAKGELTKEVSLTKEKKTYPKVAKKTVKDVFVLAKKNGFITAKCSNPGNMSCFIEYYIDGKVNKVTWAMDDKNIPASAKELWDKLNLLVPTENDN